MVLIEEKKFAVISMKQEVREYTWFLLWNRSSPLATFCPLLFSATHSYTPASSGRKYGISRTPLEWLILIFPGSGFPSTLLHEMEGTGLQRSHTKGRSGSMLKFTPTRRTAALFVGLLAVIEFVSHLTLLIVYCEVSRALWFARYRHHGGKHRIC